mgnify:CR=1 FL=1
MNIFAIEGSGIQIDWVKSAQSQDNYRVVKMILESCQMLPLCMPEEYKSPSIVESYRRFYASKPRMRYPKEKIPRWFNKYRNNVEYQII